MRDRNIRSPTGEIIGTFILTSGETCVSLAHVL